MRLVIPLLLSALLLGCSTAIPAKSEYLPKTISNVLEEIPDVESKETTVTTSMYLDYNPYDARTFVYNLVVKSNSLDDIIVEVTIYADDVIVREHVIGVDSFKKSYASGVVRFDKPDTHLFAAKITKITYTGKN